MSQALERVRTAARQRKKERFTALFHHISVELLRTAFFALKRDAAPGIDGLTWQDYEADLDRRIEDLHERVCVQRRLARLAGVSPAEARARSLVAWNGREEGNQ